MLSFSPSVAVVTALIDVIRRVLLIVLALGLLVTALPVGATFSNPGSAAAQANCAESGSELFVAWTQGALPMDYYLLAPDASQGWGSDLGGYFGTPVYYPAGWSSQLSSSTPGFIIQANDGSAAYLQDVSINEQVGVSGAAAAAQITSWLLGGSDGDVLCSASGVLDGDLPTQVTILSEEHNGSIALAYVFVIPNPSTGGAMVSYYAMAGPTNAFADLMVQVFIPMVNMYLRTHGSF